MAAKTWGCFYGCSGTVSEYGAYVKISANIYAHLPCHDAAVKSRAVEEWKEEQEEKKKQAEYARKVAESERLAKEQAELEAIYSRGVKDPNSMQTKWLPDDRKKLVAAKWICVHCGKRINTSASRASGPEQMHCHDCYMAREYGEKQAAAASTKSAAGIATVSQVLAGAAQAPKPQEPEQPKKDRFELLEIE